MSPNAVIIIMAMLDWINEYKEWFFPGLGISLFALIILGSKFFFSNKSKSAQKNSTYPFDSTIYESRPYPAEICCEIDNTPKLQRAAKQDEYLGLKVGWLTTFDAIRGPSINGKVRLMLKDRGDYPWIYCDVDLNKYPELNNVPLKTNIWVAGEITDASRGAIELQADNLKIHK